jgi:hypothetical protein
MKIDPGSQNEQRNPKPLAIERVVIASINSLPATFLLHTSRDMGGSSRGVHSCRI